MTQYDKWDGLRIDDVVKVVNLEIAVKYLNS